MRIAKMCHCTFWLRLRNSEALLRFRKRQQRLYVFFVLKERTLAYFIVVCFIIHSALVKCST